jgi:hypothetical protein
MNLSETVERIIVWRRPFRQQGKTKALGEETVKGTPEATGIGVLACNERLSEITTGKSYFQPEWQQPAKT